MWIRLHIVCDRCKQVVPDAARECGGTTCGYYDVERGQWKKYADPGEKYLCDACMHQDSRYQAVYGYVT